jgi:hypothetical protein
MWKCKKCGEEIEDSFDSCWQCGTLDDGTSPRIPAKSEKPADSPELGSRRERSPSPATTSSAMKRYSDAYLVARTIAGVGQLIKNIALVLGACIVLTAFVLGSQSGRAFGSSEFAVAGIFLALLAIIPIYVLGILVAAQGQILKATLDTAVTNSPFLNKEEMAKVMSL